MKRLWIMLAVCAAITIGLWLAGIPFLLALVPLLIAMGVMLVPLAVLYIYDKQGE